MTKWGYGIKWVSSGLKWGMAEYITGTRAENLALQSDQPRSYRLRRGDQGRLMRRPTSGNRAIRPDQ